MLGHLGDSRDSAETQTTVPGLGGVDAAMRAAVSERLGEARFGLWFGEGVGLRVNRNGDALEVRVPSPYIREWIESHYTASLTEAAEAVMGRRLRVLIQVNNETEPPRGDSVDPVPAQNEPDTDPRRLADLTIPVPGNHKAPRSFPSPTAGDLESSAPHGPTSFPPIDRLQSPQRLQTMFAFPVLHPGGPLSRSVRRLEDFVTGPGNQLAHAASCEMAQSAGAAFNPLVIHGSIGLGKTHLLEGIAHGLKLAHPTLQIIQLNAEAFTNSFLESMRTGCLNSFRSRYRSAGGLIIDDIHFLAAKRATMVEFLHTFNTLIDKGAPIILSADQHPRRICRLTDELVNRFLGGMVVKIEPPDLATRQAILHTRAAVRGVHVPEAVFAFIAEHMRVSIRELEGALYTVIAQAILTGKRLDLKLARAALRDTIRHTAQAVAIRDVERVVCLLFQISVDALKSDSRAEHWLTPGCWPCTWLASIHVQLTARSDGTLAAGIIRQ